MTTTSQEIPSYRRNMALLIHGDNAQPSLIAEILAETTKHGTITVRRVYGDWKTPQMASWRKHLHTYAIRPQQQFPHTSGKNATDMVCNPYVPPIVVRPQLDVGICITREISWRNRQFTRNFKRSF